MIDRGSAAPPTSLIALDAAILLDPADPEVVAIAEAGRAILVRLRARPFIDRLDAALARGSQEPLADRS